MAKLNVPAIQDYMTENNLDEKKLAEKMGVAHVTVYRVFRGQRGAGNLFADRLLKACPDKKFEDLFILD